MNAKLAQHRLGAGMVGLGMIFDDTYRPVFEQLRAEGLFRRDFGLVEVELTALASRTGTRAERYRQQLPAGVTPPASFAGPERARSVFPGLLRLQAAGIAVTVVRRGDDLAVRLSAGAAAEAANA